VTKRFGPETGLLLIDVQKGVNVFEHWGGGSTGRRNNPQAEDRMRALLAAWRAGGLPVIFTRHDSREAASPLKLHLPTGAMIDGFEAEDGDIIIVKDVNSAFVGTQLKLRLRQYGITRLVVAGFFTNFCVETSVRMAGNLGYDTYLAHDACATCNRIGPDGTDYDPQMLHDVSVANMHGEFCTALPTDTILDLTRADAPELQRKQGNE
jgi:nicotinamidase-related amidase